MSARRCSQERDGGSGEIASRGAYRRAIAITGPNQVWALDTTYIPMARGFVYLTAVVDMFSREVLAHKVAIT